MIWRLALALFPEIAQIARWLLSLMFGLLFIAAVSVGVHSQPWSPWWFADRSAVGATAALLQGMPATIDPDNLNLGARISDSQRFQLARAAGFTHELAILMTALSIAENGSGDPAAMSGLNENKTRDLGLWQINTIWWAQFGGQAALTDPWRNAQAAFYIYGRQGPCAWSTYEASCGPGHIGSYRAFMERARAASLVQPPGSQA